MLKYSFLDINDAARRKCIYVVNFFNDITITILDICVTQGRSKLIGREPKRPKAMLTRAAVDYN